MSLQNNLKRVEKGYITDLDNIIKDIALNHTIYTLDNNKIDYSYLYKKYISPLVFKDKVFQCSAISLNGNRCSYKSIKETNYIYCKKHMFKQKINHIHSTSTLIEDSSSDTYDNETECSDTTYFNDENDINIPEIEINLSQETTITSTNKTQKMINDKLYYVDINGIFIYKNDTTKTNTLIKCGYIHDNQYILTDDPFILENISIN